jgi:hypothetical protein
MMEEFCGVRAFQTEKGRFKKNGLLGVNTPSHRIIICDDPKKLHCIIVVGNIILI